MGNWQSAIEDALARAGLSSARCLACDVCCRFSTPVAAFIPFFSAAEIAALDEGGGQWTVDSRPWKTKIPGSPHCPLPTVHCLLSTAGPFLCPGRSPGEHALPVATADGCRCPFFRLDTGRCSIYENRPLDCRLYPFVLMFDATGKEVWLAVDEVCPVAFEKVGDPEFAQALDEVAGLLEGPLADTVAAGPGLVSVHQEQSAVRRIRVLPEITRRVCRSDLGLARLVTTGYPALKDYFAARPTCLAGHAFPSMVLWGDTFNLHWKIEADCLLVLAEDGGVSFLMAPPLGTGDLPRALAAARELMAAINGPRSGARVQEVDEELLPLFAAESWQVGHRASEYVYSTEALATLRGRHFDGKRHDCRRFETLHRATWRPYRSSDFPQAVGLLRRWQCERAGRHADGFYRAQLLDSGFLHLATLREAERLGMKGYVVDVEEELVAYTFGFPLADGQTYADFIEVADHAFQGLGSFVFRSFCREAPCYPFLNAGTDSDLPNLAQAKQLYRPLRIETAYTLNPPEEEMPGKG